MTWDTARQKNKFMKSDDCLSDLCDIIRIETYKVLQKRGDSSGKDTGFKAELYR